MTPTPTNSPNERAKSAKAPWRIAGVDARAGGMRVVTIELAGRPAVVDARVVSGGEAGLAAALKELGVARIVRVAPAVRCVSRAEPKPDAIDAELRAAVAMLAEAMLPEDVPAHRRAAGVLASPTGRYVLLTAWHGVEAGSGPAGIEESWIAEPAALGVLGGGRSCVMVSADASERSLSVIASGTTRTVARTVVLRGSGEDWAAGVAKVTAETCRAAGTGGEVGLSGDGVTLDAAGRSGVMGAVAGVRDSAWISQFGLALGAALAGGSEDPMISGLASLRRTDKGERASPVVRAAAWVGRPKNALITVGVALAMLLLAPLAIAYARLGVLSLKASPIEEAVKKSVETGRKAALYRELMQTRPPLTKLMADLSDATPVGVIVDSLSMTSEPNFKVSLAGTADSFDILNQFAANLNKTGIFEGVVSNRSDTTASGVVFTMEAKITSPTVTSRPIDDFAAKTLSARLYGENGSRAGAVAAANDSAHDGAGEEHDAGTDVATAAKPGGTAPRANPDGGFRRNNGPGGRNNNGGGGRNSGRTNEIAPGGPATAKPGEPPPELSDEAIAAMTKEQATKEWGVRKGALYKPSIDATTKARLEAEVKKLDARMKAAATEAPK